MSGRLSTAGKWTRRVAALALSATLVIGCSGLGRANENPAAPNILQQMRSFATMGSVLYIAAHPDDENTRVITYLARGRGYRTAYLSLTRGDGGQNLLGPQFGEQLGVARTQDCLLRGVWMGDDSTSPARKTSGFRRIIGRLCGSGIGRKSWLTSCA